MYRSKRPLYFIALILAPSLVLAKNSGAGFRTEVFSAPFERSLVQEAFRPARLIIADRTPKNRPENRPEPSARRSREVDNRRLEDLTPKQREEIERRQRQYENLPQSEKDKVKKARQQFRELPPERRRALRDKWERMSPEDRRRRPQDTRNRHGNGNGHRSGNSNNKNRR